MCFDFVSEFNRSGGAAFKKFRAKLPQPAKNAKTFLPFLPLLPVLHSAGIKRRQMNKCPLSVCMISAAEAHRIGRALESVAPWAAEIIVVLNEEVTDGTEEIARRHGAKVFREPWRGFVAQKNSALQKATQPWVLGLDADEVVTPELRDQIMAAVLREIKTDSPAAYEFSRLSFYCGRWIRHGDWYPDRKTLLWQRDRAKFGGVDPHAALLVEGEVGRLRGDLLHYTSETINHQIAKTVQYADVFAKNCEREKRRATFLDLLVRPPWRFVRGYFFRLGFLDGWQGFAIAWLTAFYTFLRYVRVREDELRKTHPP